MVGQPMKRAEPFPVLPCGIRIDLVGIGGSLDGKRLLIHAEQGLGDTIQFCRYLSQFSGTGKNISIELPHRFLPLLSSLPTQVHHISTEQTTSWDLQIPLLSLPHLAGPTEPFWPEDGAYLKADPARVTEWSEKLPKNGKRRIAICWQGNPDYRADANRSVPLENFAPIGSLPDIQLISMQQGEDCESLPLQHWGHTVLSLGNEIDAEGAFLDSAAILKNVHLLITSDTAIAHLGGALGIETWLVLAFVPDWRWGSMVVKRLGTQP